MSGGYDARPLLSPASQALYAAARTAASGPPSEARPLLWNDMDQVVQPMVEGLIAALDPAGPVVAAVGEVAESLRALAPLM